MKMTKLFLIVLPTLLFLCACSPSVSTVPDVTSGTGSFQNDSGSSYDFPSVVIDEPPPEPEPEPEDETVKISIVGDVLIHNTLISNAYDSATGSYDFSPSFQYVEKYFDDSDVVIAQVEGTFAGSDWAYSGYPSFNTPEDILSDLKETGITLISLAGNHAMDFGWRGLVSTYNFIEDAGLDHVGTYISKEDRDATSGVLLKEVNGLKIAFLSYTYGTNGIPVDKDWSVNILYNDYLTTFTDLDEDAIISDLEAAKAMAPDLIVAMVHWGTEYRTEQNGYQEEAAQLFFENGADIVFGGHPHVLEPMEMRTITTADGSERNVFVSFSLGNFISGQYYDYTNLSTILSVEITKDGSTGQTSISDVSYIPTYCTNAYLGETDGYYVLDIHSAISGYEDGSFGLISDSLYASLVKGLDDIHSILGTQYDAMLK